MSALPVVALVGRPNVGKSTLFNRLIGSPQAIVQDEPGTTRDRNYGQTIWNDKPFLVVDTGGMDFTNDADISLSIRHQAEMAIEEADVIVFMVDAQQGLTAMDLDVADILRRTSRPVVLAANKAESAVRRLDSAEFYALGLGEPVPISGHNGLNTGDLLDAVAELLPREEEPDPDGTPRVTLVGRPNVGKSSLLNALLQQDRALVSPTPGTTRDTTDTALIHDGRPVILVDTAGIRKRGHIDAGVERYSVLRSMRAISRADVAVLVIDATEPLAAQDAHIAGYVWDEAKGLVIVVNKWDLVVPKDDHTIDHYTRRLRNELHFLKDAPMLFTSALTRQRVRKILDLALQVRDERSKRVPTAQLNTVVGDALKRHQPVSHNGKLLKLRYVTQAQADPPTFIFFVNDPLLVHFSYRRFLENQLREHFGFTGTAIRMIFRSSREAPVEAGERPARLRTEIRRPALTPGDASAQPIVAEMTGAPPVVVEAGDDDEEAPVAPRPRIFTRPRAKPGNPRQRVAGPGGGSVRTGAGRVRTGGFGARAGAGAGNGESTQRRAPGTEAGRPAAGGGKALPRTTGHGTSLPRRPAGGDASARKSGDAAGRQSPSGGKAASRSSGSGKSQPRTSAGGKAAGRTHAGGKGRTGGSSAGKGSGRPGGKRRPTR